MSEVESGADIAGLRRELGALLRRQRKNVGHGLESLSRQLDRREGRANGPTSKTSLSRIENGDQTPTEAVVTAILTVTKANPEDTQQALQLLQQITNAPNTRPSTPPPPPDTEQPGSGTSPGPPRPPQPSPAPPPRGRSLKRWLIPTAAVAVLGVGVVLVATQPWASEPSQQEPGKQEPGKQEPSKSCTPPVSTEEVTGTPSSTAVSSNGAAYAEFYRDQGRFVLIDDRKDERSAVLQVRLDGQSQQQWSNCFGKTGRPRKDGTIAPPKIISLPGFDRNATVEFRTCVADDATEVIDNTCGNWTVDRPR